MKPKQVILPAEKVYRILLVEDECYQRLALLDILTLCKYDAECAVNGKQAMDILNNDNNNFDLVLLDLSMPELSGDEVLELISNDPRLS